MSSTKRQANRALYAVTDAWDAFIDTLERAKPGDCSEVLWSALTIATVNGLTTALAQRYDAKYAAAMQEAFKQAFDDIKKLDQTLAEGKKRR